MATADLLQRAREIVADLSETPGIRHRWLAGEFDQHLAVRAVHSVLAEQSAGCVRHPERPIRETLDGDPLCQECCDAWARAEGEAARGEQP